MTDHAKTVQAIQALYRPHLYFVTKPHPTSGDLTVLLERELGADLARAAQAAEENRDLRDAWETQRLLANDAKEEAQALRRELDAQAMLIVQLQDDLRSKWNQKARPAASVPSVQDKLAAAEKTILELQQRLGESVNFPDATKEYTKKEWDAFRLGWHSAEAWPFKRADSVSQPAAPPLRVGWGFDPAFGADKCVYLCNICGEGTEHCKHWPPDALIYPDTAEPAAPPPAPLSGLLTNDSADFTAPPPAQTEPEIVINVTHGPTSSGEPPVTYSSPQPKEGKLLPMAQTEDK